MNATMIRVNLLVQASKPISVQLEGQSLINTVIGVMRYFGDVKLGIGDLTSAYS